MKRLLYVMTLLLFVMIIAGCSNDTEENDQTADNDQPATEENNEQTDTDENVAEESNDQATTGSETESTADTEASDQVLSLGETGTINNTLGQYNITVESVETSEGFEDYNPGNGIFIIANVTIENIGDQAIQGEDISGNLFNAEGNNAGNKVGVDHVENITGEIATGESVSGQLLFDHRESDSYDLVFGFAQETVSNELTWQFTADEMDQ